MSFSWPTPSNSSLSGIKSSTTNSFADALKRLAEHVEEKNKNNTTNTNNGTSCTVTDPPNQINVPQTNHSAAPEQALRLYTQYIQEMERRDDLRRYYLRNYPTTADSVPNNPCRFLSPNLSSLIHPSLYLQTINQQQQQSQIRLLPPLPPSPLLSNAKTIDTTISSSIPAADSLEKKSETSSKSKSKLFRPYDLDSPTTSISPSTSTTKKSSTPSPNNPSSDDFSSMPSSGKEKQLLNSLGLVQPSIEDNNHPNKSSSASSSSFKLKRKSFSSAKHSTIRKQVKLDNSENI